MGKGKRLKHFNYDVEKYTAHVVDQCATMGISAATIELDKLEIEALEKYGKNMMGVTKEYAGKLPEGHSMIYYCGKRLTFKPKNDG